jgi:hypothetical protein
MMAKIAEEILRLLKQEVAIKNLIYGTILKRSILIAPFSHSNFSLNQTKLQTFCEIGDQFVQFKVGYSKTTLDS